MDLKLINDKGEAAATVAGSDALFGRDYNEALIHQVVTAYQANARRARASRRAAATSTSRTRSRGAQKGTGRARAGQANSPLWRGGGKIFPNSPDENFSQKVNRKMYRAGMASILSQLVREERLAVIDALAVDAPKTKALRAEDQGARAARHACSSSPTSSTTTCSCRRATCPTCWCSRRARSTR